MQPPSRQRRLAQKEGLPMPRSLTHVCLLVVTTALAACAAGPAASQPTPSTMIAPSPAGSDDAAGATSAAPGSASSDVWLPEWADEGSVPAAVSTRRPLPFCGVERAPAPQPREFIDRAVRLCFWDAHHAGTEAEFASVQTTMEGAPIATVYRTSDGTVELLTDFSQDRFGSGGWLTMTCRSLVEGEGESLLGVDDCGEATPVE